MKKLFLYSFLTIVFAQSVFALDTVFDSMDKATEVKLAPAIKTSQATNTKQTATQVKNVNSAYSAANKSIKEEKFNNALVNLDDAQVELRQELANVTSKYNVALQEKERAIQNCKALKKEINEINKKMNNIDKSKKMISKSIDTEN